MIIVAPTVYTQLCAPALFGVFRTCCMDMAGRATAFASRRDIPTTCPTWWVAKKAPMPSGSRQ